IAASELSALGDEGFKALPAADDGALPARLQDAVAKRYRVESRCVVPCLGVSGALYVTLAALFDRGDEIVVDAPHYEPLRVVPLGLGLKVRHFTRHAADRFALVPDRVLEAIGPSTKAVLISNPHNPSGTFADDSTVSVLAAALEPRGIMLLIDEVYREFVA